MQTPIVRKRWAIAEGYIPGWSQGPASAMASYETVCILYTTDRDAQEELAGFYTDRVLVGPYHLIVSVCRIKQVRLNALVDPGSIPPAVDYASVIESDVPLVVQYLRRDSRLAKNALVGTIAYACNEKG